MAGHEEKQVKKPAFRFPFLEECSRCQLLIPGVGRLRTGERHPNFHRIEFKQPAMPQAPIIKAIPEKVLALR